MTNLIKILFIILGTYGCNSTDFSVEDKLYECFIQEYKNQEINIIPLLDSLENNYIKQGVLKDKSGQAKLDFYKKIGEKGEIPFMDPYIVADRVATIPFFQNEIENCIKINCIDSTELKKSKYYKLTEEFKKGVGW